MICLVYNELTERNLFICLTRLLKVLANGYDLTKDTGVHRDITVLSNFELPVGRATGLKDPVVCPNFRLFITKDGILTLQKEIIGIDKSVTWKTIPTVYER